MGRFPLGRVVCTVGALRLIESLPEFPYLQRHASGDWGDVDGHDRRENERSVKNGWRILSAYETPQGKLWIVTEADRSSTCILLPEEY